MAEEEVVAAAPSPVASDHKRKLEDVEPHAPTGDVPLDSAVDPDADHNDDVAASVSSEAKRPRLDEDKTDNLASENGFDAEKSDEPAKEEEVAPQPNEEASQQNEVNKQAEDGDAPSKEAHATLKPEQVEETTLLILPSHL